MEATCKYCGKPLTRRQIQAGSKCCSRTCGQRYAASLKVAPPLPEVNCEICGKPLTEKQIKNGCKCCSSKCGALNGARKKQKPVAEVKCKNCGKLLTRAQISHSCKFCSRECSVEMAKESQREADQKLYKKKCAACGKEFTSVGFRRRYCSDECRQVGAELSKARAREQYQKQKAAAEAKKTDKHRLEKDLAQANAHGMSYGRWKAMQYIQSLPKIETRI